MNIANIIAETLKAFCYFILFLDISSRMVVWFGAERTATGAFLRSVSNILSFPFQRLLDPIIRRHPFFESLPRLLGTVFIYLLAASFDIRI